MARTKPKARARKRILADDEIRDVWTALRSADVPACYPAFVKMLLLTATRRNEAANMHTAELEGELWTIPRTRYKTKLDHVIPLAPQAHALIGEKPPMAKNSWFIFSTSVSGPERMPRWTLHDLRRTARSLMSRAKVPTDHAERILGHVSVAFARRMIDTNTSTRSGMHSPSSPRWLIGLPLQLQPAR
jgi:integrase